MKYCLLTYRNTPFQLPLPEEDTEADGKKEELEGPPVPREHEPLKPGQFLPQTRRYYLELFSSVTWTPVDA
jgi:hypothetical protein